MRIRKYDFDYGRRALMEKSLKGTASAGVLSSLWPLIGNAAEFKKAYPDELLSIELYTKGKIKPGDIVDANNVEHVKDLLDPIAYRQIKEFGRRVLIKDPVDNVTRLFPKDYLEATLRNEGKAVFDENNNVRTKEGGPWIGGSPFPDAQTGLEAIANITLSWGRHNSLTWAVKDWDIGPGGDVAYQYDLGWCELNTTSRTDQTVFRNMDDMLRLQSVWFTAPRAQAGSSFLNLWYYDQRKYPDLYGYFPAFKRVRQFPTNQRFEPLVPGITLFLSDAWCAGDPMLTWGNYKIVDRKPMLGSINNNWKGSQPNWENDSAHGGKQDQTYFLFEMELIPETIVLEAEPVMYPRSPVSKKRMWIDVRNNVCVAYNTYDRKGEIWKSVEVAWSQFVDGDTAFPNAANPAWSWAILHIHDIQDNRMSRFNQTATTTGGYKTGYNVDEDAAYDQFLTTQSLRRLGA